MPHVEFTREIARRFNHLYGREPGFEEKARSRGEEAWRASARRLYRELRTKYLEQGDAEALDGGARAARRSAEPDDGRPRAAVRLSRRRRQDDPDRAAGAADRSSRMPGLDGQKMSKSYDNTIGLREDAGVVTKKIRTMPTDPARVKRTDPGDPEKCPVWQLHLVYSDEPTQAMGAAGLPQRGHRLSRMQAAGDRGDSRGTAADARARAALSRRSDAGQNIVADGCEKAQKLAEETMRDVRDAMGLDYA